jgi:hypothetical protein
MDKTAIKNFSIWARNKLIADIKYRAGLLGITENGIATALPQSNMESQFFDIGTVEPYAIKSEEIKQRKKLVEEIEAKKATSDYATAYKYILEEVAYTWFNRLIAVRFMEVNDYLPSHVRVLSSETDKLEPDMVTSPFDTGFDFSDGEQEKIIALKHDNNIDGLFKMLFIRQCNELNSILPALFEKTNDYTELLLNVSITDKDGVVYHLVHDIEEDDFNIEKGGQVEIIGWLYQYYNTELKDETFANLKKNIKITKDRIPSATQLFTPDWIVHYMVENSLGRIWIEHLRAVDNTVDEKKKAESFGWRYYLPEAEQDDKVNIQLAEIRKDYKDLKPTDIKCIDPCMGSGHILVVMFDVLMDIYRSEGYSERAAAFEIVGNNIHGLDIDKRAYQLAYFAVMMKGRGYNRRFFNGKDDIKPVPIVYAIMESNDIARNQLQFFGKSLNDDERDKALQQIEYILNTFVDAKEYGSILNVDKCDWELLERFVCDLNVEGQHSIESYGIDETQEKLKKLVQIAKLLGQKYEIVVTNPPYMGISGGNSKLNDYAKKYYPDSKSDMFAVFIEKCSDMIRKDGYQAMITQHSWMFLSSFEKLREKLQMKDTINMAHLGARAFEEIGGEVVQTTSWIMRKGHVDGYNGTYCRLIEPTTQQGKEELYLAGEKRYTSQQDNFSKIPGSPVAYWVSGAMLNVFSYPKAKEFGRQCLGMRTGDNERFLRLWHEVEITKAKLDCKSKEEALGSGCKWFPYNKGGEFRKWYGNMWYVVNWENDGKEIKELVRQVYPQLGNNLGWKISNEDKYFRKGIAWSRISSSYFGVRLCDSNLIFDTNAPMMFASNENNLNYYAGILTSKVATLILSIINPTISFQVGDIGEIPIIIKEDKITEVDKLVESAQKGSHRDWDSFETSWDFKIHPLIAAVSSNNKEFDNTGNNANSSVTISECYNCWENECNDRFNQLKANEEELNRIFIDIYGLQDELTPEVEDKDVTVRKADLLRDIKSLILYAVGCMFGRYSLDVDGLAYAGGEWDDSKYTAFKPCSSDIIPITDEQYLEEDIVSRFCMWLKTVFGEKSLEINLDFIAKTIGGKGNSSRDIIRNYFIKDFFTDHVKIYQKRPIYWLFDSGKQNGFKALIYIHRYNIDTIGNVRIDYMHRMQRVYESELNRMQDTIDNSKDSREVTNAIKRKEKLQKQLKETREYDEKLGILALSRIELDLDDGVKVNYRKVQTASDGTFYEILADSKNIMAKQL